MPDQKGNTTYGSSSRRYKNKDRRNNEIPMIKVNNGDGTTTDNGDGASKFKNVTIISKLDAMTNEVVEREDEFDIDFRPSEGQESILRYVLDLMLPGYHEEENDDVSIDVLQQLLTKLLQFMIANIELKLEDTLVNSFSEFEAFMPMMMLFLEVIRPETPLYALFLDFMGQLGSNLLAKQPAATTLCMENIGLEYIVDFAKSFSNRNDALAHIIVSFTPYNSRARLHVIEKLAKEFKSDMRCFAGLLAHLSIYKIEKDSNSSSEGGGNQDEDFLLDEDADADLFDYFWMRAMQFVDYS